MNHHRETNFVSRNFPFTIDDCLVAAIRLVQFFSYEFFTRVSCLPPFNEKRRHNVQKFLHYLFRRIWRVNTNKPLYNDHSHRLTDWLTDIVRCQHLFPLPYPVSLPFSFEFVRKKEGKKWDINRKKNDKSNPWRRKNIDWWLKAFSMNTFFVGASVCRWYFRWYDKCQTNKNKIETHIWHLNKRIGNSRLIARNQRQNRNRFGLSLSLMLLKHNDYVHKWRRREIKIDFNLLLGSSPTHPLFECKPWPSLNHSLIASLFLYIQFDLFIFAAAMHWCCFVALLMFSSRVHISIVWLILTSVTWSVECEDKLRKNEEANARKNNNTKWRKML